MLFTALLPTLTLLLSAISFAPTAAASNSTLESRHYNQAGWTQEKCANVRGVYYGYNYNLGCLCEDDVESYCANNGVSAYFKSLILSYIQQKGTEVWYPPHAQPTCDGGYSCGSLTKLSDGTCGKTTCDPRQCSSNGGCCPRGQTYYPQTGKCCGRVGTQTNGNTCSPVLQCPTYESNKVCCPSGTSGWTGYKTVCCPKNQFEKDGQCVCADGFTKNGNSCTSNCPTGHKWCSSRCCPEGSSEKNNQCVCDSNQQTLQGSGAQAKCVNRCADGFTFYTKVCCPAGAKEQNGQCVCTSAQQELKGTGNSAKCVDKCPTGAQINSQGQCQCTSNQQTLQGAGASAKCVNRCADTFTFYSTTCCPAGAKEQGGKCVCTSDQQSLQGTGNAAKCVDKCSGGNKWCHSKCCKSYQDEVNGQCVCPTAGYIDNGRACVPKCKDSEKYNPTTGGCDKICDESAGYFYQMSWRKRGMCCKRGQTACNTVCCPLGKEEIGDTGICCVKGSKVEGKRCIEPTGGNNPRQRALAGRLVGEQINLSPSAVASYGLEANKNGKLCPAGLAACPIEGRESDYECVETLADLQSCGGCASLGAGQDCTLITGAKWMGCNVGKCEVYSCKKGYKKSADGSHCIKL